MNETNSFTMVSTYSPMPTNIQNGSQLLGADSNGHIDESNASKGLSVESLLIVIYLLIATTVFLFMALLVVGLLHFSLRRKNKKLKDQLNLVLILKKDDHKVEANEKDIKAVKIEPTIVQDDLASHPRQSDHTSFKRSKKNNSDVPLRQENEYVKEPCQGDEGSYVDMGRPESEHIYEDDKWIQGVVRPGNKLPTVKEH
ncbi:unnamed protein product [Meganyctiphanes norvegica]|uniref:Uncharacterized protein n=1 Tax=Meganyctiphanes norvegica TaxID=48144 RepID=A0AAV2RXB7_MEGNR